jgi:hypothetical protein
LSYEHAGKIEAQLTAEVAELLAKAEAADQADVPDGLSIPAELERRKVRVEKLAAARATMSVSAARARQGARRVEPCDHGLESEADVHPLLRPVRRGEDLLLKNDGERHRSRQSGCPVHTLIGRQSRFRDENLTP